MKPHILAIIPARSGSKGIRNKNIRDFCGKPLLAYTIEAALKSKMLDRVIVSTDSEQYAQIARTYGAEVPFLRPKSLARDTTPIVDTILDVLKKLRGRDTHNPDYIMLLQPTSPLRTARDIQACVRLASTQPCDGVVSVCSTEQLLYTIDRGFLKLEHKRSWLHKTNRQSLPATYKLNGAAVYLIKTEVFLRNRSFLLGNLIPYVMGKWQSIDLDTEEDFIIAETLYAQRVKK